MTWFVNMSGHINSTTNTAEAERALALELHEAIKPIIDRHDLHSASFTGNHVCGSLLTGEWVPVVLTAEEALVAEYRGLYRTISGDPAEPTSTA